MRPSRRLLLPVLAVVGLSCTDSIAVPDDAGLWDLGALAPSLAVIPTLPTVCSETTVTTLIADEVIPIGTVEVSNDGANLYVVYRTSAEWPILKTAVFMGDSPSGIPVNGGGNPRVGKFPHKSKHPVGTTEVVWQISLDGVHADVAVVAVFAEVGATVEGAWGEGDMISPGGNWSMYFTHSVADCGVETVGPTGGTVSSRDGNANITVPAGALTVPVDITIEEATVDELLEHTAGLSLSATPSSGPSSVAAQSAASTDPALAELLPSVLGVIPLEGTIWDFGPDGQQFDEPVTVTLRYEDANIPPGFTEDDLDIWVTNGIFEPARAAVVDFAANTVTAEFTHFSYFFIGVQEPADVDLTVTQLHLSSSDTPAKVGRTLDFFASVSNMGPDDSRGGNLTYMAFGDVLLGGLFGGCTEIVNPIFGDVAVACDVSGLAPGASDALPAFQLVAQSVGDIDVWATVSTAQGDDDPDGTNDQAQLTTPVQPAVLADLRVTAVAESADPIELGQNISFTATVQNLGPDGVAQGVAIYTGFGNVTVGPLSPGCTEQVAPPVGAVAVWCDVGAIASGASTDAPVAVFVPGASGDFTIWASPGSEGVDPDLFNNRFEETYTVTAPQADLEIFSVTDTPDPAPTGASVVYSVQVVSTAAQPVDGATLLLNPLGGATFVSASDPGCFGTPLGATCPLSTLAPGLFQGIDVTFQPNAGVSSLTMSARVNPPFGTDDPDLDNNWTVENTTVGSAGTADLSISALSESADPIQLGESVTYTATIQNFGPNAVSDAVVYYQMFGNAVAGTLNPACTENSAPAVADVEIVCSVGALGAQDLSFAPWAIFTPQGPGDFTVWVSPGSSATDPNTANNRYEATVTVTGPQADLRVDRIADDVDPVPAGSDVTYDIDVIAMGASEPVDGAVLRVLFTGDAVLSSSTSSCSVISGGIACPLATLQPGLVHTVQAVMTLSSAGQTVSADATVVVPAGIIDPDLSNNTRTETTVVTAPAPAQISVGQVIEADLAPPGDSTMYTFQGTAGQWLRLHLSMITGSNGYAQLVLYGPGGTDIFPAGSLQGRATDLSSANHVMQLPVTGTYHLVVRPIGSGPYRLGLGTGEGRLDTSYGPSALGVVKGPGDSFRQMQLIGDEVVTLGEVTLSRFDAAGSPKAGFGSGGSVDLRSAAGLTTIRAGAVRVQPDGRIVVAGHSYLSPYPWIVARFDANGALDPTFGTGGWTSVSLGGNRSSSKAVGIGFQQNGADLDIVVAGDAGALQEKMGIIRLNPDGSLDSGFGTGGIVFENAGVTPVHMDMQADGSVLVSGFKDLLRYTADGVRDTSFGAGGRVTYGFNGNAAGMSVLPGGDIMVLGQESNDAVVMRLTPAGTLDGSFAGGGLATYDFGLSDRAQGVVQDASGNLLVVGYQRPVGGDYEWLVVRMSGTGVLDPTFGVGGYTLEARVDDARAVALDTQGRIVVGGQRRGTVTEVELTRHIPN